jgi:LytR cell envelope-related transcriptional attenuator
MRSEIDSSSGGAGQSRLVPVHDEVGVAAASVLAVVSMLAVLTAVIMFLTTGDPVDAAGNASGPTPPVVSSPTINPAPTSQTSPTPTVSPTQPASTQAPASTQPPDNHHQQPQQTQQPNHHGSAQPSHPTRDAYVEVYNNSSISGLAAGAAATLQDVGWQVVGTDNWYGNIPSNTVYYPAQLRTQARQLAKDLGISRIHPAVPPMRFDRLTVILTGHL